MLVRFPECFTYVFVEAIILKAFTDLLQRSSDYKTDGGQQHEERSEDKAEANSTDNETNKQILRESYLKHIIS